MLIKWLNKQERKRERMDGHTVGTIIQGIGAFITIAIAVVAMIGVFSKDNYNIEL